MLYYLTVLVCTKTFCNYSPQRQWPLVDILSHHHRQETLIAETFFAFEKQKMFLFFFSETFCFLNKCFPVCAPRKQCCLDFRVARSVLHKLSIRSFFFCSARKHCFSLVCAPINILGNNASATMFSSFVGAFRTVESRVAI